MTDRLLNEAEAIELLALGDPSDPSARERLRWLRRTRKVPFVRLNSHCIRYSAKQLADAVEHLTVPAEA